MQATKQPGNSMLAVQDVVTPSIKGDVNSGSITTTGKTARGYNGQKSNITENTCMGSKQMGEGHRPS